MFHQVAYCVSVFDRLGPPLATLGCLGQQWAILGSLRSLWPTWAALGALGALGSLRQPCSLLPLSLALALTSHQKLNNGVSTLVLLDMSEFYGDTCAPFLDLWWRLPWVLMQCWIPSLEWFLCVYAIEFSNSTLLWYLLTVLWSVDWYCSPSLWDY